MENENKWEYDYSASNNETGYPNVGSSGMNTANQYNEPEAQPVRQPQAHTNSPVGRRLV